MPALTMQEYLQSISKSVPNADYREFILESSKQRCTRIENISNRITEYTASGRIDLAIGESIRVSLRSIFRDIAECIKSSEKILELGDNWDGEASVGYSEDTLRNAINFLVEYSKKIFQEEGVIIQAPRITPAPEGSIDLFWEQPEYDLLINIVAAPSNLATFYGDDKKEEVIKGQFILGNYKRAISLFLMGEK